MEETRLGAILLENPVIREQDVQRCLEIQRLTGSTRPLGRILVDEGVVSEETLAQLLAIQRSRRQKSESTVAAGAGQGAERFLEAALSVGANELLISENRPVRMRVAGQLRTFSDEPARSEEIWQFIRDAMGADAQELIAEQHCLTRAFARPGRARGRITAFRHFDGIAVQLRLHGDAVRSADAVGLADSVLECVRAGQGMVLLTGLNRCGISETLAAAVAEVAQRRDRLVLVLDEDLESPPPAGAAEVVRRRVGEHTRDYPTALHAAISQDPDVIVAGDVSSPQAFDLALRAAESGRLVICALRAKSVTAALERALSFYAPHDLPRVRATLAAVLRCVLALELVPDARAAGQELATELLLVNHSAREVIRDGALAQIPLLLRIDACGHSLDSSLRELFAAGRIRFEEAFSRAEDKAVILQGAPKRAAV
jgi:twitching motility protein PilT